MSFNEQKTADDASTEETMASSTLTQAQKCVMLALAVAVDFDFFTLHSESRGCV